MSGKQAKRMRAAAGAVMTGRQQVAAPDTAKQLRRAARVLAEELTPDWARAQLSVTPQSQEDFELNQRRAREKLRIAPRRWPRGRR